MSNLIPVVVLSVVDPHWFQCNRIQRSTYVSSNPDPAILVNVDPDPGIWWTKYEKLYSWKILIFILRPRRRRSKLQETPPTLLKIRIHLFLLFLVIFAHLDPDPHSLPCVSDPDPADQNQLGSIAPGSTTLFFSFIINWHKGRGGAVLAKTTLNYIDDKPLRILKTFTSWKFLQIGASSLPENVCKE
jgi:hypothetical protein